MRKLRKITEQFLIDQKELFNEEINFVIKPHPNESVIYWNKLIEKNNLKNCYLMVGKNINELLAISDFHISHNICTTTAEAMMCNLATLEIKYVLNPSTVGCSIQSRKSKIELEKTLSFTINIV